jgi:hypothetical protein
VRLARTLAAESGLGLNVTVTDCVAKLTFVALPQLIYGWLPPVTAFKVYNI